MADLNYNQCTYRFCCENDEVDAMSDEMVTARDMTVGGVGILEDGQINTERFSLAPVTELEVSTWNAKRSWQVRRERTDHRVVVAEIYESRWMWHSIIPVALAVTIMLMIGILTEAPMIYMVASLLFLVPLVLLVVRYERSLSDSGRQIISIVELDTVMWHMVKDRAKNFLANTAKAQNARYKAALAQHSAAVKKENKKAKRSGKKPVSIPRPHERDYIKPQLSKTLPEIVEAIHDLLSPDFQAAQHAALMEKYRVEPDIVLALGTGVRGCGCAACMVAEEMNLTPPLSGFHAARRMRKVHEAMTEPPKSLLDLARLVAEHTDKDARRKYVAAREVHKYEKKKAKAREMEELRIEREKQKERERKSKEYLAGLKREEKARRRRERSDIIDDMMDSQDGVDCKARE